MLTLTRRGVLLGATALTAAGMMPLGASANDRSYHALLVAVTKYPNLPPKTNLIGPMHDAVLVKDYLLTRAPVKFEPQNVTLLADDLEGAVSPTHAAIKEALATLAVKVKRDDFVYIHMSGHGTQQPQLVEGDETDSLDEIFLPADTDKWTDRAKGVPNALMDNEIGAALDAIRDKGAFVWIIFDCCHSGTATRAAVIGEDYETERKVDFLEDLVDPAAEAAARAEMAAAQGSSRSVTEDGERKASFNLNPTGAESIVKGGLVAFYAAQSIETTPEMPLPKGAPDAPKYGLFTFTIFSKLAENPMISYRQLGHAVLSQYAADGRTRPTPLFEGKLDARVFEIEDRPSVLQWQIVVKDGALSLPAGLLHGLTPGSRLAIVPSPEAELSATIGYLEILPNAKNLESKAKTVEFDGKPALKAADLPATAYARAAELVVDFKLVVARPGPAEGLDAEVKLVNGMLDTLAAKPEKTFNIALVEPGQPADLRFAVLRENAIKGAASDAPDTPALWFLPPSGDVSLQDGKRPPLVAIDMADPQKLTDATDANLETIYRATSLSRLAAASAETSIPNVSVEFQLKRQSKDEMTALQASSVPIVNPGDEIHIVAKNSSTKLVDINILYIGSDYSITHIDAQRLVSNAEINEGLLAFTDTSFGMERMIAVLTEAPPLSEIEDLKFLEHGGVPAATRAIGGPLGFSDMLRDIGMAPETRSAMKLGDKGGAKGAVMVFPLETVPRNS